jgi:hypothetical protein
MSVFFSFFRRSINCIFIGCIYFIYWSETEAETARIFCSPPRPASPKVVAAPSRLAKSGPHTDSLTSFSAPFRALVRNSQGVLSWILWRWKLPNLRSCRVIEYALEIEFHQNFFSLLPFIGFSSYFYSVSVRLFRTYLFRIVTFYSRSMW